MSDFERQTLLLKLAEEAEQDQDYESAIKYYETLLKKPGRNKTKYEEKLNCLKSKVVPKAKEVCRFFQKTGQCKFGDGCKYSHDIPVKERRLCGEFQRTGTCRYKDNCKFSHKLPSSSQSQVTSTSTSDVLSNLRALFSSQSLNQEGLDCLWVQPNLQHSQVPHWHGILKSNSLERSDLITMRRFIVGCFDQLKSPPGGEEVLVNLVEKYPASTNAFIRNVVHYPSKITDHSFQKLLVPFTLLLVNSRMQNSSLPHLANFIYSALLNHLETFVQVYIACLKDYLGQERVQRTPPSDNYFLPFTVTQCFLPFVELLSFLNNRFHKKVVEPYLKEAISTLVVLSSKWRERLEAGNLYEGALVGIESAFPINLVQHRLSSLLSLVDMSDARVRLRQIIDQQNTNFVQAKPVMPFMDMGTIPVFSKHDNDFEDFTKIKIMPTMDEILSQHRPTLPGNHLYEKSMHWLPPGPERLLDTHFRLLREDMIRSLKDSIQTILMDLKHQKSGKPSSRQDARLYPNARVLSVKVDERTGCRIAKVKFSPPEKPKHLSYQDFWTLSKRLETGVLVCLLVKKATGRDEFDLFFGTVFRKDPKELASTETVEIALSGSNSFCLTQYVTFNENTSSHHYLLEANKIILNTYSPIMKALQSMSPASLPFKEYICPKEVPAAPVKVNPPLYAQIPNFRFDLSHLTSGQNCQLDPTDLNSKTQCMNTLKAHSTLDEGQCEALVQALSSEIVCIQGPPGTGKSFVGVKIVSSILHSMAQQDIGPILVLCYTNHALDQFLCHLLDMGIESIARVGSRSKEPRMEPYDIGKVYAEATPQQRYQVHVWKKEIEVWNEELQHFDKLRANEFNWNIACEFLMDHYYDAYLELKEAESRDLGWTTVGKKGGALDVLEKWSTGFDLTTQEKKRKVPPRIPEEILESSIWDTTLEERKLLLEYWKAEWQTDMFGEMNSISEKIERVNEQINSLYNFTKIETLKRRRIIGATTNGAAKHNQLLRKAGIRVIIIEEAGEVLEAHVLANLTPNVQHFISIGDHLQLRPQISEYDLSLESKVGSKYRLDLSLFERLQEDIYRLPLYSLSLQRRMRPAISALVRETLYPNLKDAPEVSKYPHVRGVTSDLHFFNHDHKEDSSDKLSLNSKSNSFEVDMTVQFLKYLLRQGYRTSNITILTPYLGQLSKIRKALSTECMVLLDERDKDDLEDFEQEVIVVIYVNQAQETRLKEAIRVSTIDNYQGEEADIIIISLVRNFGTSEGTIGFLKTSNRINVLLSRARHGMFLMGNSRLLSSYSPMWKKAIEIIQKTGTLDQSIPIVCAKHPDYISRITDPNLFPVLSPDGGCLRACGMKLIRCGHQCPRKCHSDFADHSEGIYCPKPCERFYTECQHPCEKICGQDCGNCSKNVGTILLECGHSSVNTPCYSAQHPETIICRHEVTIVIPTCGHEISVPCYKKEEKILCRKPCSAILPCAHVCSGRCGDCVQRTLTKQGQEDSQERLVNVTEHEPCAKICGRPFVCGHSCQRKCHAGSDCDQMNCNQPCKALKCDHGTCAHPCKLPCSACAEECTWSCEHEGKCMAKCGFPCTRSPCDKRCTKILSCGHICPSVCGEPCPSAAYCQNCASEDVLDQLADMIMFEPYRDIQLDESPIFVFSCGHIKTRETMDGTVGFGEYFKQIDGKWVPSGPILNTGSIVNMPVCPDCRTPIQCKRYGRIIKRAAIDTAEKVFIGKCNERLSLVQKNLEQLKALLSKDRIEFEQIKEKAKGFIKEAKYFRQFAFNSPTRKMYNAFLKSKEQDHSQSIMENVPQPMARFLYAADMHLGKAFVELSKAYSKLCQSNPDPRTRREMFMDLKNAIDVFQRTVDGATAKDGKEAPIASKYLIEALFMLIQSMQHLINYIRQFHMYMKDGILGDIQLKKDGTKSLPDQWKDYYLEIGQRVEQNELKALSSLTLTSEQRSTVLEFEKWFKELPTALSLGTISEHELFQVYQAMKAEFRGGSHWYRCPNGHYYSIGECGMAMQQSTCPECGAVVGGGNHTLNPTNEYATDFEQRMERLRMQ